MHAARSLVASSKALSTSMKITARAGCLFFSREKHRTGRNSEPSSNRAVSCGRSSTEASCSSSLRRTGRLDQTAAATQLAAGFPLDRHVRTEHGRARGVESTIAALHARPPETTFLRPVQHHRDLVPDPGQDFSASVDLVPSWCRSRRRGGGRRPAAAAAARARSPSGLLFLSLGLRGPSAGRV